MKDSPRFAPTVARPPDGPEGGQASLGRSPPTFCAPCAANPPRENRRSGTLCAGRRHRERRRPVRAREGARRSTEGGGRWSQIPWVGAALRVRRVRSTFCHVEEGLVG